MPCMLALEEVTRKDEGEDDVTAANGGHGAGHEKRVLAKIEDTPEIREAREELDELKEELKNTFRCNQETDEGNVTNDSIRGGL